MSNPANNGSSAATSACVSTGPSVSSRRSYCNMAGEANPLSCLRQGNGSGGGQWSGEPRQLPFCEEEPHLSRRILGGVRGVNGVLLLRLRVELADRPGRRLGGVGRPNHLAQLRHRVGAL